jgi:hypothetical protein
MLFEGMIILRIGYVPLFIQATVPETIISLATLPADTLPHLLPLVSPCVHLIPIVTSVVWFLLPLLVFISSLPTRFSTVVFT